MKITLKKLFSFDPGAPLYRLALFWMAIFIPILVGVGMLVSTLSYSHTFSWTTQGVLEFWNLSKLQLSIISLAIPFGTVVAVMHRSEQVAEQIRLSKEQSRFKNFYEHRSSFVGDFQAVADKAEMSNRDVSYLYANIFKDVMDYNYYPHFPEEWCQLCELIKKGLSDDAKGNFLSEENFEFLGDLENIERVESAVQGKIVFMLDVLNSIDEALQVISCSWLSLGFRDNFDIHDDEDMFFLASKIGEKCAELFKRLQVVIEYIYFGSFASHFACDEVRYLASTITNVSLSYHEVPGEVYEILFDKKLGGKENIYSVDQDGNIDNGRTVLLSFSFSENDD